MDKRMIERWTDTVLFAVAVGLSGVLLLPVLGLGLLVSTGLLVAAVVGKTANVFGAVVVVLSVGGALGLFGFARAGRGVRAPARHNVTATMVCLAIGITTALTVAAFIITVPLSDAFFGPSSSAADAAQLVPVVAAPLAWVLFGIGWMQRLARRYAEDVGHAYDGIPATLLFIAVMLATTAVLISTAL